jgi:pyridoxine 4-dehydrogenase
MLIPVQRISLFWTLWDISLLIFAGVHTSITKRFRAIVETTTLGNTDLKISRLGFGAMNLSLKGRPSEEQGIALLHRVLELGVTFIDTADAYCINETEKHHNERLIASALDGYEGEMREIVIATKGGCMRPSAGEWTRNGRPDHIREAIRESSEALGGRTIHLWQHHAPDPEVPIEETLEAAREMREEGLIEHVGVSNYTVDQLERVREIVDVVSVQNRYNPWHRRPESGMLSNCEKAGITFIPYSPLGGTGRAKSLDEYEGIADLAAVRGISPQRLVLAWLMSKSPVIVPIPGATRIASVEDSVRAVETELNAGEITEIDRATAAVL